MCGKTRPLCCASSAGRSTRRVWCDVSVSGICVLAVAFATVAGLQAASAAAARATSAIPQGLLAPALPAAPPAVPSRELIDKYCIGCHNERTKSGNMTLDKRDMTQVAAGADVWEKVLRKLQAKATTRLRDAAAERRGTGVVHGLDRSHAGLRGGVAP